METPKNSMFISPEIVHFLWRMEIALIDYRQHCDMIHRITFLVINFLNRLRYYSAVKGLFYVVANIEYMIEQELAWTRISDESTSKLNCSN